MSVASIGSVYKAMSDEIGVSKTAVYGKLNRLEPNVSKALVKSTATELATIIHQLEVEGPEQMRRISNHDERVPLLGRHREGGSILLESIVSRPKIEGDSPIRCPCGSPSARFQR